MYQSKKKKPKDSNESWKYERKYNTRTEELLSQKNTQKNNTNC